MKTGWRAFGLFPLLVCMPLSAATFSADKDALVRSGRYADKNFGGSTKLAVKNEGDLSSNTRESWLDFDISSLSGTVIGATVRVFLARVNGTTTHQLYAGGTNWLEGAITWHNQPVSYPVPLATSRLTDRDDGIWIAYDVSAYLAQLVASREQQASFVIAASNNVYSEYSSSETANAPELLVTTDNGGRMDLDPSLPPGGNFDLSGWKITFPDATEEPSTWLVAGGESVDEFYTDPVTGGMVFQTPNIAGSTSGSSYSRTELREMLRLSDTSISTQGIDGNNWVLSTSSSYNKDAAGGVDGRLEATLSVNRVSTSGDLAKVGRIIVGQIHASTHEPCRLYYRKLPGNSKGSVYIAHETNSGSEQWYELIGSRSSSAADPADGIELGESWSYVIEAEGNALTVTIRRDGKPDVVKTVDMSASGFADDWMYFKAGLYNQNNTGDPSDYAKITFYKLNKWHN